MPNNMLLLPVLAQVLLTIFLYVALAVAKGRALKAGLVDLERRALHDDAWPESVMKINNNIRNQFEVPILFYVLALMLWQLADASSLTLALALAWLFVASRIVHAWIHTHSNYVPARRRVFTIGAVVVLAMAAVALLHLR